MIRFGSLATRGAMSGPSWRFVRDVAASCVATGVAALVVTHFSEPAGPELARSDGAKLVDRLASLDRGFVEETVPVRQTRIFDTLAMFSLPQVEPSGWSERPVQVAKVAAELPPMLPAAPVSTPAKPRGVPQMVTASAEPGRHPTVLPPSRPVQIAAAITSQPAALAPAPANGPLEDPPRERLQVLGWQVPGTDLLPTRREAGRAVASVGSGAAAVGTKAVTTVSNTAVGIGRAVSSAGSAVFEAIGLD